MSVTSHLETATDKGVICVNQERLERIVRRMKEDGLPQLVLSDPSTMEYVLGYPLSPMERMYAMVVSTEREPVLLLNDLFVIPDGVPVRQVRYFDTDDSAAVLAAQLDKNSVCGVEKTFIAKLLLALPGGMAPSERQTLVDVIVDAGVRSVVPVDEGVASAIGAGMRIDQPYGRMNIDIGGGRTNVSVFSFGHQIVWDILNVGGDRFDDAIIDYLRKKHNLLIGARTAEELKIDIGSARMRGVKLEMDACGRSLVSGLPRAVTVSSEEMIEALDEPLRDLMSALHRMIERTPPELASDIFDEGITLSGGGAQLFGLDGVISDQLKIRTTLADEPDLCVAHGLSELIDDEDKYEKMSLKGYDFLF